MDEAIVLCLTRFCNLQVQIEVRLNHNLVSGLSCSCLLNIVAVSWLLPSRVRYFAGFRDVVILRNAKAEVLQTD